VEYAFTGIKEDERRLLLSVYRKERKRKDYIFE